MSLINNNDNNLILRSQPTQTPNWCMRSLVCGTRDPPTCSDLTTKLNKCVDTLRPLDLNLWPLTRKMFLDYLYSRILNTRSILSCHNPLQFTTWVFFLSLLHYIQAISHRMAPLIQFTKQFGLRSMPYDILNLNTNLSYNSFTCPDCNATYHHG